MVGSFSINNSLNRPSAPHTSLIQELGCGCALVGLLAGQMGAARVVMTDCKVKMAYLVDKLPIAHLIYNQHYV